MRPRTSVSRAVRSTGSWGRGSAWLVGEPRDQPPRHARCEQRVACGGHADGVDELASRCVLQEEPTGTCGKRGIHVLVEVEGREDDHLGGGLQCAHPPGRLEAVHARHPDVHEHDIGCELFSPSDGISTVDGIPDHTDVRLGAEDHPEAGADELLVVGQQHPDHADVAPSGIRAWTEKPPAPGR